ncbi:MAG TPA: tetratricopeptide repeat protein, partial [Hyphomicrobiaceae bacterium]|nr:tetratricopeptide repeat protein [Hyphomicrobiaceae bacterium]
GPGAATQVVLERGLAAYKVGNYESAVTDLQRVLNGSNDSGRFVARFYLARIYADTNSAFSDPGKAYLLFQKLADENADVSADQSYFRGPFVAKALVALAGYLQSGVPGIGVRPDPKLAQSYLHHAATVFNDRSAQFELSKIYLSSGNDDNIKRAMHYLSVLSEESHPGAQALLAEQLWRGRNVPKDERRALALIKMAVENAPARDRLWIEDIYQNIFCAASKDTRKHADGFIALWRKMFTRPVPSSEASAGPGDLQPRWACHNGEMVEIQRPHPDVMQGSTAGFSVQNVGATAPAR